MSRFSPVFVYTLLALVSGLVPVTTHAHDYVSGDVVIEHPWSRPTPPGTSVGVGYMAIHNKGETPVTLISVESSVAERVTLHESLMRDGLMKMRPLKGGLTIPAGAAVELKPHSYHLMLEPLRAPLRKGDRIPLTLTFEGMKPLRVELIVGGMEESPGMNAHTAH